MKRILFFIILMPVIFVLRAPPVQSQVKNHTHEHHAMESAESLPGASIWQLNSIWVNHEGRSMKLEDLRGRSYLVVMLFTRCETACPLIVEDLKEIMKSFSQKQATDLGVVIFSLDSERDTPAALAEFAKKQKLSKDWKLFTSKKASSVSELATALGVRFKKIPNGDFIHSNTIYFLDKEGVVQATKEGLKTSSKEFVQQIKSRMNEK